MQLSEDERDELRSTARRFLDQQSSSLEVRALLDDATGHDPALWSAIAELGWLAIRVPEEHGGMGASFTDVAVILHELGRHVTPAPVLASLLGAEALLVRARLARVWVALRPVLCGLPPCPPRIWAT